MIDDESPAGPASTAEHSPAGHGGFGSLRLFGFALLGVVTMAVARFAWFGEDHWPMVLMGVVGALWATAIVVDTVYHGWRGQGYACMKCGHKRKMASFRWSAACPNCGE